MFIIDSTRQLIAAEPAELARWGVQDIYEAARAFRDGSLRLDSELQQLSTPSGEQLEYRIESMDSLLGHWNLCYLIEASQKELSPAADTPVQVPTAAPEEKAKEEEEEELLAILPSEQESTEPPAEPLSEDEHPEEPDAEEELLSILPFGETLEETSEEEPQQNAEEVTEEEADEELLALLPVEEEEEAHSETDSEAVTTSADTEEDELLSLLDEDEKTSEDETSEMETEIETLPESDEEEILSLMSPEEELRAGEEAPAAEQEKERAGFSPEPELPPIETEEPNTPPPVIELPDAEKAPWEELESQFQPNLRENARRIELSPQEYADLIRDFVQESRSMRPQLLENDDRKRQETVAILRDAISLLQLRPLDRLLEYLNEATDDERVEIVNEYDRLLDQLHVGLATLEEVPGLEETEETQEAPAPEPLREERSEVSVPKAPEPPKEEPAPSPAEETAVEAAPAEEAKEEEQAPSPEETGETGKTLSPEAFIEGVKPIPIEFSLQIASEELNLPEDLVLEFINDFAKQGHEYLPVLIDAYQKGDLDHLQKTAHMLKGAASNLRIEAMVDNLYDLQFDNDIERAPQRIRLFAGQLMSLDNYLKQMNQ